MGCHRQQRVVFHNSFFCTRQVLIFRLPRLFPPLTEVDVEEHRSDVDEAEQHATCPNSDVLGHTQMVRIGTGRVSIWRESHLADICNEKNPFSRETGQGSAGLTVEVFSRRPHDSEGDARREERVVGGCERFRGRQFPAHQVDEDQSSGHLVAEVRLADPLSKQIFVIRQEERLRLPYLQECAALVAEQSEWHIGVDGVAEVHPTGFCQELGSGNGAYRSLNA
jgi:hypothetical protein